MKIADWPHVEVLIHARNHLVHLRDQGRLEITIDGQYQARDLVDEVTPAIKLALRNRIVDLDRRLRTLGVSID